MWHFAYKVTTERSVALLCNSQNFWLLSEKKEEVSQLIAARVASDNIYASIGRLGMTHPIGRSNKQEPTAAAGGKPQNYRSKMVRPKAVTKTGSYLRIINLWFSAQNRHLVLRTGKR